MHLNKNILNLALTTLAMNFGPLASQALTVADFSGHWVADSGKVSSTIGMSSDCSKIEIIIEQSEGLLLTKKYQSTCTQLGSLWGPTEDVIKGNKVFEHEQEVGSISEDSLMTTSHESNVTYLYNLQLVKNASGETVLKSTYGARNMAGTIFTEAQLHRVGPAAFASQKKTNFDHQATAAEIRRAYANNHEYHQNHTTQNTVSPARPVEDTANFAYVLMSEQEPNEEVTNLRRSIAQNLPANVKLVILANSENVESVKQEYHSWISADRLIVVGDASTENGLWARDSFPVPVYDNESKKVSLVNAKYYRDFSSGDAIAQAVGASHNEKKDFTLVGGNIIADENGNCFSVDSYRLFGTTQKDIIAAYGCKTHHMMPHVSGIGDVDEVLKPLPGKKILTNAAAYQKDLESWGYEVILLPDIPNSYRTYANALIVGSTVFMPTYGVDTDASAQAVYEKLGYKVVGIPTNSLSDDMHGSIHCQTMAYPPMDQKLLVNALSGD